MLTRMYFTQIEAEHTTFIQTSTSQTMKPKTWLVLADFLAISGKLADSKKREDSKIWKKFLALIDAQYRTFIETYQSSFKNVNICLFSAHF